MEAAVPLTLPPQLKYGYVTWRALFAIADGPEDPDDLPDAQVPTGTITFTPLSSPTFITEGEPVTILGKPVTVTFDDDGRLVNAQSDRGTWLVVGQYRVSFAIPGFVTSSITVEVTEENVAPIGEPGDDNYQPGNPLDLTLQMPLSPPPPAVKLVVNEQLYLDTTAAAQSATQAAAELNALLTQLTAEQLVATVTTISGGAPDTDYSNLFKISGGTP